jgi:hypothetical protein
MDHDVRLLLPVNLPDVGDSCEVVFREIGDGNVLPAVGFEPGDEVLAEKAFTTGDGDAFVQDGRTVQRSTLKESCSMFDVLGSKLKVKEKNVLRSRLKEREMFKVRSSTFYV